MQGPEPPLERLGLELAGVVDGSASAVLDAEHRTVVNGHYFYASTPEHAASFRAEPHRYSGPLLDPVNHSWFTPDASSPRLDTDDGILLFASTESRSDFERSGGAFDGHVH